jgi:hypothetical protein
MTKTLLDRDAAAKLAAESLIQDDFLRNHEDKLLKGLSYKILATVILNVTDPNNSGLYGGIGEFILYQNILIYAGIELGLFTTNQFDDHLRLQIDEWKRVTGFVDRVQNTSR